MTRADIDAVLRRNIMSLKDNIFVVYDKNGKIVHKKNVHFNDLTYKIYVTITTVITITITITNHHHYNHNHIQGVTVNIQGVSVYIQGVTVEIQSVQGTGCQHAQGFTTIWRCGWGLNFRSSLGDNFH